MFSNFLEKWAALETSILWRSNVDISTQWIIVIWTNSGTIHFVIVWAHYLPSRVTGQEKVQISAGPNTNQYPLASVLCKSSGKPSTRFPLGRLVELKTSPTNFIFLLERIKNNFLCVWTCFWKVGAPETQFFGAPTLILTLHLNLDFELYTFNFQNPLNFPT